MEFPTSLEAVHAKIDAFDPQQYARTRNFLSGGVSYLSPYLSRGFITIPQIIDRLKRRGFGVFEAEKFIQELAWREFYTRTWFKRGDGIFQDIRQAQFGVKNYGLPDAIIQAKTGIKVLDKHLSNLPTVGYLHNHIRMYTAAVICNVAKYHWSTPAAWMYFHLLDGDLASNALSWQWCAGTFSQKQYYANQSNINTYSNSHQKDTFLDFSYEDLPLQPVPEILQNKSEINLKFEAPKTIELNILPDVPNFLYTHYTLDPTFHAGESGNRILILEPSHFLKHPISARSMNFILDLASCIPNIQVFYGEFSELTFKSIYRDHPVNAHFKGIKEPYPSMAPNLKGDFPSFFSFWNALKNHL